MQVAAQLVRVHDHVGRGGAGDRLQAQRTLIPTLTLVLTLTRYSDVQEEE